MVLNNYNGISCRTHFENQRVVAGLCDNLMSNLPVGLLTWGKSPFDSYFKRHMLTAIRSGIRKGVLDVPEVLLRLQTMGGSYTIVGRIMRISARNYDML